MYEQLDRVREKSSLTRLCFLLSVSRRGYYRWKQKTAAGDNLEVRDALQRIALEYPFYGYRRITHDMASW